MLGLRVPGWLVLVPPGPEPICAGRKLVKVSKGATELVLSEATTAWYDTSQRGDAVSADDQSSPINEQVAGQTHGARTRRPVVGLQVLARHMISDY